MFEGIDFQRHSTLPYVLGVTSVIYLLWRAWRFSLVTALYPNVPRELPYWVPREHIIQYSV